jgi:phosphatidylglycerophosphate synthase
MFRKKTKANIQYKDYTSLISGKDSPHNCILGFVDKKVIKLAKFIPPWLETYHLTLSGLPFSILHLYFFYLAKSNINWLLVNIIIIILRYLSDALDGEIGRIRNTGLVRWGFYMDHFIDYIYMSSIFLGFSVIFPNQLIVCLFALVVFSGIFLNEFLTCMATNKKYNVFGHFGFGPTELQTAIILVNIFIMIVTPEKIPWFPTAFFLTFTLLLIKIIYQTHKKLWKTDMYYKNLKSQDK